MSNSTNSNNPATTATTAPAKRGRPAFTSRKSVKRSVIRQVRFSEREWGEIDAMAADMGYRGEDYPSDKIRAILKMAVTNHKAPV